MILIPLKVLFGIMYRSKLLNASIWPILKWTTNQSKLSFFSISSFIENQQIFPSRLWRLATRQLTRRSATSSTKRRSFRCSLRSASTTTGNCWISEWTTCDRLWGSTSECDSMIYSINQGVGKSFKIFV